MVEKQKVLALLDEYSKLEEFGDPITRWFRSRDGAYIREDERVLQWGPRDRKVMTALVASARDLADPTAARGDTKLANRLLRLASAIEKLQVDAEVLELFLRSVRVAALALPSGAADSDDESEGNVLAQDVLVTLSQVAPVAGVRKRTLDGYLQKRKIPEPDVRGGGGKAHKWYYRKLREALKKDAKRLMPADFPLDLFMPEHTLPR